MNDYFMRLAARALGLGPILTPLVGSKFEPDPMEGQPSELVLELRREAAHHHSSALPENPIGDALHQSSPALPGSAESDNALSKFASAEQPLQVVQTTDGSSIAEAKTSGPTEAENRVQEPPLSIALEEAVIVSQPESRLEGQSERNARSVDGANETPTVQAVTLSPGNSSSQGSMSEGQVFQHGASSPGNRLSPATSVEGAGSIREATQALLDVNSEIDETVDSTPLASSSAIQHPALGSQTRSPFDRQDDHGPVWDGSPSEAAIPVQDRYEASTDPDRLASPSSPSPISDPATRQAESNQTPPRTPASDESVPDGSSFIAATFSDPTSSLGLGSIQTPAASRLDAVISDVAVPSAPSTQQPLFAPEPGRVASPPLANRDPQPLANSPVSEQSSHQTPTSAEVPGQAPGSAHAEQSGPILTIGSKPIREQAEVVRAAEKPRVEDAANPSLPASRMEQAAFPSPDEPDRGPESFIATKPLLAEQATDRLGTTNSPPQDIRALPTVDSPVIHPEPTVSQAAANALVLDPSPSNSTRPEEDGQPASTSSARLESIQERTQALLNAASLTDEAANLPNLSGSATDGQAAIPQSRPSYPGEHGDGVLVIATEDIPTEQETLPSDTASSAAQEEATRATSEEPAYGPHPSFAPSEPSTITQPEARPPGSPPNSLGAATTEDPPQTSGFSPDALPRSSSGGAIDSIRAITEVLLKSEGQIPDDLGGPDSDPGRFEGTLSFPESQSGSEGGVDPDFGLRESTKELLIDQETLRSTVADSSIETGARRTTLDGVVDEPGHASLPSEAVPQTQSQVRPSGSMPSSLGSQTSEVSPQSGSPLLRPAPLDSTSAEATESLLEAEARRPGGLDQPQLPSSGVEQAGPYSRVSQMDSLDLPRPDQGHQKAGSSLGAASPGLHATRDTDTVREATEALLKAEAGISADIREMGLVSTPIERTSPMSEPQSQVSRGFDGDFDVQDSTKEVPFEQAAMPSTLASSQSETSALRSTPDGSAVSPHASSLPPTTSIAPQLEVSPHSPSSSVGPLASEGEPRTGSLMPADSIRAITETLLEAESPAVAGSKPALFSNAPIDPSEAKPLGSQPSSLELRRPEEARALADSSIDSGLPDSSSPPDTSSIREETESLLNAQSRAGDDRIQTTSPDPQIVKTLSMREAEALRGVRRDPGANQSEVTEGGPIDQVAQPMSQAKSLPLDALVVPLGSEPHHVPSTPPSVSAVHATSLGSVIRDEGVRNGANEDKPAPETNSQDSLGGLRSLPKKIEETRDHRSTDRAAQLDLTSDRASASIREVTESLLDAAAFDVDGRHDIARSASAAHGESPQAEPASLSGESIHPQSAPDVLSEELRRSASTSERVQESQAEPDSQAAAQRSPRLRDEGSSTIHAIPIAPAGLTTVRSSESIREVTDALCYAVTNGGEDAKGSISWTPSAMRTILDGSSQDSAEMVTHRAASTSALNEESLVVGDMPLSESNLADASPSVAVRGHARPSAGATKPGSSSEEGVESIRDAGRSPLTFVASSAGASDDTGQSAHSGPQGAAAPEHSPRSGGLHRQDTASKEATEVIVSEPRVVSANLQQASPLSTTVQESHLAMNAPEIRSSSPTMQNAAERVRPGDSSDHIVRQDAELERGPDSNRQNAKSPFVATSQRVEDPAIVSSAPTSTTPSAAATVSESSIAGVRNQQAVLRGITEELLVEHSSQPSPQATAGHREPNHESSPSSLISRASDGNNNQDDRRPQDQLHAVLPAAKSGAHSSLQSESPAESTISNEKPGLAVPEENRLGTEDRSVAHVDGDRFQSSKPTNNAESAPRLHSTRPDLEPPEADLSTAQSRPSPGSVNYHVRVAPRMRHHRLGETAPSPTMPTHFMPWPATPLSDVAANLEIPNSQPSPEHFRAEGRRVLRVLPPARNVGKSPTPFFIGEAPLDALLNTAATEAALVPFAQGPRVTTEPMEPVLEAGVTPLIDTPPVPRQSVSTSIAPVEGPPSRRLPRTSAIDSTLLDALPSDSVEAFRQILKHNTTALAAEPLPQRQEPADIPREAGFQSKRAAPRETGPSEINLHIASISLPDDAPPETKMKAPRGKPRLSLAAYLKSRNEGR